MLIDFIFDFETRSRKDLKVHGPINYAMDPSTEATLLTYCFGRTGTIKVWRRGEDYPLDLADVMLSPEKYRFIAWNLQFDYLIWTCVFAKGHKRPAIANLDDAMALSTEYRTGASLEAACKMTNMPTSKDQEGRRLMLKQCKPNSRTGEFTELTPEEWIIFERYGIQDTRLLRDIYYRLPSLPHAERWAFEWTFIRNLRGIRIDEDLVNELESIVQENMPKLVAEFDYLVGFKCKMGSAVKCKEFFKQYYPWIENLQADTVAKMLAEDPANVPAQIRRALEIRDLAGSTSIAKIPTTQSQKYGGRVYALLAYGYTQTKRWAGRGIQVQNFPRPDDSLADKLDFDLNVEDLVSTIRERRRAGLQDPIGFVKNLLRRMFLPTPGNRFYCGDFSKVEPSVLFWLTGLGPIPKKWYEEMASEIYSIPVHEISKDGVERQVGKAAALSCGYGTGWKGFRDSQLKAGLKLTDELAQQTVAAYRRKYKPVADMWRELEIGFRKAIYGESTRLCNGKVFIMPMQHPWKGVQIRLPSGSHLYYHHAQESQEEFTEETYDPQTGQMYKVKKIRNVLKYLSDQGQGRVAYDYVYGGLLCENVVSATARDILVPAMWRLEQAGFEVLSVVHDEVWADAKPGREEEFNRIMCQNPSWCSMEIGSDLKCGVRYLK
jgi:DNA polymerase